MSFKLFVTKLSPAAVPWQSQCRDVTDPAGTRRAPLGEEVNNALLGSFPLELPNCMVSIWHGCANILKNELCLYL